MLMVMSTTDNGRTIRPTDMVSIAIWMGPNTKDIGQRISSMVKDWRLSLTVLNTTANTYKVKSTEKASAHGPMVVLITESLLRIIFKVKVNITGPMVVSMTVSGKTTKWKVMECLRGQMVDATRDHMLMIRKKEKVTSFGQMAENTKVAGRMVSNTESVLTLLQAGKQNKENGRTVKGFTGFKTPPTTTWATQWQDKQNTNELQNIHNELNYMLNHIPSILSFDHYVIKLIPHMIELFCLK